MESLSCSRFSCTRRKSASVIDLRAESNTPMTEVPPDHCNTVNRDDLKITPDRAPLRRRATSSILLDHGKRSIKIVPTLFLGRFDSLPDADDVFEKLKDVPCERKQDPLSSSKSMCVVFDLDNLSKCSSDSAPTTLAVTECRNLSSTSATPPIENTRSSDIYSNPSHKPSPKLGDLKHSQTLQDISTRQSYNNCNDVPKNIGKHRSIMKRSQSEFAMNVPKTFVYDPNDPLKAFRSRFSINKSGKYTGPPGSASKNIVEEKSPNKNISERRINIIEDVIQNNDSIESLSRDNVPSIIREPNSVPTRATNVLATTLPTMYLTNSMKYISQSHHDDAKKKPLSIQQKRRKFKNTRNQTKIMNMIEKSIGNSLSRNLSNVSNIVTAEVNRQMTESTAINAAVHSEVVYNTVYDSILKNFDRSINVPDNPVCVSHYSSTDISPDRNSRRNYLRLDRFYRLDGGCNQSRHSVSCLDLSARNIPSTSPQKMTSALSFADLGLSDDFSYSKPRRTERHLVKNRRTKSFEMLDSSDVEIEGDFNNLPLEHHIPLKTALVPLCRQLSDSIQNLTCNKPDPNMEGTSLEQYESVDKSKTRPKSLLLKLRVNLEELEKSEENDPSNMEWDYYDNPKRNSWDSDEE